MKLAKATLAVALMGIFSNVYAADTGSQSQVVEANNLNWGYLNPLRGDQSPGATDLWGDRTKDMETGMLVKFNKGFTSPPHIHNITYRGIVIKGLMHNDDPNAEEMWMPAGSFWTQPAGETHVTAADGQDNMIYLEIDSGPYLVQPADEHFDNGEKPLNLAESNIVWLDKSDVKSIHGENAQISSLWGSNQIGKMGGSMVKLPAGYKGSIDVNAKEFRGVVIKGNVSYHSVETKQDKALAPGSYFGSTGEFKHGISVSKEGATIYIRTNGKFEVNSK
ncbi:DUF4437 domain-containing protein [Marinomonas pollencensis]|uniref:Uncharacterized protein DUF4437 n=1 Tax=Marinomonas pollencensis TaxID=491954 RepID=A0A3E0DT53_9GAMM|nr:DUF4437 domain-containing protein [Marinomonas pollencensis]REG85653.1 uncharacterized protein DUF4437 [Marinomonas pollencensis]